MCTETAFVLSVFFKEKGISEKRKKKIIPMPFQESDNAA